MATFKQHTHDSLSDEGSRVLNRAEETFGMAPNLIRVLAESPTAANAYLDLHERFSNSSLSAVEQQVVALAASFENECHYCMAAESGVAKQVGMDADTLEALRHGTSIPDTKLEALRIFTRTVVEERGFVDDDAIEAFLQAGYRKEQVLDVVLGVTKKTLSNYTNHLAETPVDDAFSDFSWSKAEHAGV